ncbi:putative carboxylesterase 18 [Cucumis melo var. makuwa]|uniref:Carboxylesterase 18 n=1 Tax=Cucumis melo var. makuwa TaxID=1194695 RepID=A0A5A7T0U6_CUCMM|nr:putative carboxylesterase 18 [Cucumis melo var. makuwa]
MMDRTDWYWKAFLPKGCDRDHPSVNFFGPNSTNISNIRLSTTKVLVGGLDLLIDWQKRYYEALKKSGKEAYLTEYLNAFHSFYGFLELAECNLFIKDIRDFVKEQCSKKSS